MSQKFLNSIEVDGSVSTNHLQLDTTPSPIPTTQGALYFDQDDEALAAVLNGYVHKIGEDVFYPVKNQTGSSIPKGTAVQFAGTLGASGRLLIAPFIANGSVASTFFMGVTAETIGDGADGKVLWFGRIKGINTNAFNEGDVLYASTTVAGGFQTTVPQAPNNIVQVAAVVTKSINQGVIFIRPTIGSNINKDEGVKITTPATGNVLQLQSNGLWENKTLSQAGIQPTLTNPITGTGTTNYVAKFTGTTSLGNSQIFDNGTNVGIGTSTPSQLLELVGLDNIYNQIRTSGANSTSGIVLVNDARNWVIRNNGLDGDKFQIRDVQANAQRLTIDTSGNVGIGTSSPNETLTLYKADRPYLQFVSATTGTAITDGTALGFTTASGEFQIRNKEAQAVTISTSNIERMRITSTGNVGIGTATMAGRLNIAGASSDAWASGNGGLVLNGHDSGGVSTITTFLNDSSIRIGAGTTQKTGILITGQSSANGSTIQFSTGASERMRITSAGNVGIGTSSVNDSAILHLESDRKGFLPPVMTNSQMNGISSPAEGLMIYNKDEKRIFVFNGDSWQALAYALI